MAARIVRRLKAAEDAERIADFIAKVSLPAALSFLENLESTLVELAKLPESGSRFESTRPEWTALRFRRIKGFPKHLVFYFSHQDAIEVVRVLHGAQDLDAELRQ